MAAVTTELNDELRVEVLVEVVKIAHAGCSR